MTHKQQSITLKSASHRPTCWRTFFANHSYRKAWFRSTNCYRVWQRRALLGDHLLFAVILRLACFFKRPERFLFGEIFLWFVTYKTSVGLLCWSHCDLEQLPKKAANSNSVRQERFLLRNIIRLLGKRHYTYPADAPCKASCVSHDDGARLKADLSIFQLLFFSLRCSRQSHQPLAVALRRIL